MLFRPTRVVRVTSKEDFDAALASADQVIVEGDDRLLSYAAAKASNDPELSSVAIEVGGHSIFMGRDVVEGAIVTGNGNIFPSSRAEREKALLSSSSTESGMARVESSASPPQSTRRSLSGPLLGMLISVAFLALAIAFYFIISGAEHAVSVTPSGTQSPSITEPQGSVVISPPSSTPTPSVTTPTLANVVQILQSVAWPAVAIAAIFALFFIARQAIAGGQNVEISWKITEKVAGRVVITKVRSRIDKTRSAAQ